MFLSVYWLKSMISIGIIITLLLGVTLLYVLVYAFLISSVTAQILPDFRNIFIAVFMALAVLMILSSLSGIYGIIRKKNKFVIIYSVTMLCYFVIFIIMAAFMIKYPTYLRSECSNPSPTANSIREAVQFANSTLCKDCECFFNSLDKYSVEERARLKRMNFLNYTDEDDSAPVNAQNCPQWDNITYKATNSLIFLQSVFNCSGWCQVQPQFNLYYLFTDVNRGIPQQTCIQSLLQFFSNFGNIMMISCFCMSCILFFILLTILCLCCHPDRGQEYDAMKFFKSTLMVELNEEQTQGHIYDGSSPTKLGKKASERDRINDMNSLNKNSKKYKSEIIHNTKK